MYRRLDDSKVSVADNVIQHLRVIVYYRDKDIVSVIGVVALHHHSEQVRLFDGAGGDGAVDLGDVQLLLNQISQQLALYYIRKGRRHLSRVLLVVGEIAGVVGIEVVAGRHGEGSLAAIHGHIGAVGEHKNAQDSGYAKQYQEPEVFLCTAHAVMEQHDEVDLITLLCRRLRICV